MTTPTPKGGLPRCHTCGSTGSPRGRRPGVAPEQLKKIAALVTGGALARDAARTCEVSETAYYEWLKLGSLGPKCPTCGRKIRPELVEFAKAIEKARADRRILLLGRIAKAAQEPKHWTAAAWILERTDPEEFAQRVTHVVRTELEAALDRLEAEFAEDPALLDRIQRCLAGGPRRVEDRPTSSSDAGEGGGAGGAADPSRAEPEPSAVPRE